MTHTFLPVIIDKSTGRIAYVNVAHIEQIDPINKLAHMAGADGGTYQLSEWWKNTTSHLRIGGD